MPRGVKPAEAAASAPAEAASKGAKGKTPLTVNKAPLKKKDGQKDGKLVAGGVEAPLDLAELEKKRKELTDQLLKCEIQIHRLETQYFETANPQGNALKGYDGLLSSTAGRSQFKAEDRIFSGSSVSGSAAAAALGGS
ncbi:hypothetical protein HYH03_005123 [Edaphochlamys debaryana]|uniref:Chromatin modification-related protein EAF6 n=1 Tax=Edaphochlamys debaryana TaxID=47281 RepID=A0A835Y5V2_9CHLO|nr:hypothetical protein HYH03_005123 [Edaphochlamys debaryana]|eukprot:KAG2496710.1 hypothetical protein HYH03_005123 [Edaphochlamys debaryana]